MASINKDIRRYEITTVYSHPEAKADIILVHGLNGHPHKTWRAKNDGNEVFWPTDLLPQSLKGLPVNVLVYGYNADVYSAGNDKKASDNFILQHAQSLVTSLTYHRKDEGTMHNPIIWVAHSLGGILTKRAILYSNDLRTRNHEDYRSVYVSTYAIIFLGTPHTGSGVATWGHVLQAMSDVVVPKKLFHSEPILLKTLKRDNETLQSINNHFSDISARFKMHMAHENHRTNVKATKIYVVDATSASPQMEGVTYYGIEATHSGMCKFDSVNAPGFRTISTAIREWVMEGPEVIELRWSSEERERLGRARDDAGERMMPYLTTPRASQPQIPDLPSTPRPASFTATSQPQFPNLVPSTPRPASFTRTESEVVSIQTEGEVTHFMKDLDGSHHPVLDTRPTAGVLYDEKRMRWEAHGGIFGADKEELDFDELYEECCDMRDGFSNTVNKYRRNYGLEPISAATHNWNSVEKSVEEVSRAFVPEGRAFAQRLKAAFKDAEDKMELSNFVASFTPASFGLCSILCAGLGTIFSAVARAGYDQGMNALYITLEEMPSFLNGSGSFLDNLKGDKEFHQKVAVVFTSTLKLLRTILKLYLDPAGSSSSKSSALEKIKERATALKVRANKLHRYAAKVSHLKIRELEVLQRQNLYVSSLSLRAQDDLRERLDETLQRVRALEGIKGILTDSGQQFNLQVYPPQPEMDVPVSESPGVDLIEVEEVSEMPSRSTTPNNELTAGDLFEEYQFHPSLVRDDCETLLQLRSTSTVLDDNKLLYMTRSVHLRAWLELDESTTLLINGGGESRPDAETSLIAAKLASALLVATETQPGVVAVAFFCGQHTHLQTDPYASPAEMAMSLLLQLVQARQEYLGSDDLRACFDGLDPLSVGSVCDALERLVDTLDSTTILFVVLDGVSFFAHPAWRLEETTELLGRLVEVQKRSTSAVVKLLFTAPSRAMFAEELVSELEVVNVPTSPPNVGPWTDAAFGELFEELEDYTDDSSDG